MIRSQYLSTLAIAALIGAAPAFAQTSAPSKMKEPTTATQKVDGKTSGKAKAGAAQQNAATKPLCSELSHPNAGKLADKETGKAKDNSSSPVHMDCTPDSPTSASATGTTTGSSATTSSSTSTAGSNTPSPSSTSSATSNQSVTGSSANADSNVTGSSTDVNSSVTGSTSTFTPSIDLRGRSTLTIDNTTTTGDQSLSTNATTTTGDQSLSSTTSASTGDQSLSSTTSATTNGASTDATAPADPAEKAKKKQ